MTAAEKKAAEIKANRPATFNSGKASITIENGETLPLAVAKASLKTQGLEKKELTQAVKDFTAWQIKHYSEELAVAKSELLELVTLMVEKGYHLTAARYKANGGVTISMDPSARTKDSGIASVLRKVKAALGIN